MSEDENEKSSWSKREDKYLKRMENAVEIKVDEHGKKRSSCGVIPGCVSTYSIK